MSNELKNLSSDNPIVFKYLLISLKREFSIVKNIPKIYHLPSSVNACYIIYLRITIILYILQCEIIICEEYILLYCLINCFI